MAGGHKQVYDPSRLAPKPHFPAPMNPIESSSTESLNSPPNKPRLDAGSGRPAGAGETIKQKVRRTASPAIDQTKEKVSAAANRGKEAIADRLSGYGEHLRNTARSAEEEDPNIAHFAHTAADRLERVADYVREADFGRLREDAADVARRHPSLFMGGMFLAGVVMGNLAKASVQTLREDAHDEFDGPDDHQPQEYDATAGGYATDDSESFSPEVREGPQI
jgi:hypothetical protein